MVGHKSRKIMHNLKYSIAILAFAESLNAATSERDQTVVSKGEPIQYQTARKHVSSEVGKEIKKFGGATDDMHRELGAFLDEMHVSTAALGEENKVAAERYKEKKSEVEKRRQTHLGESLANEVKYSEGMRRESLKAEENDAYQEIIALHKKEKAVAQQQTAQRLAEEKAFIEKLKKNQEDMAREISEKKKTQVENDAFFERSTKLFEQGRDAIIARENARQKIEVRFIGGITYTIREDVLKLIPYFKDLKKTPNSSGPATIDMPNKDRINPTYFKRICDFIEAALTMDKDGKILVDLTRNSKYQYMLFRKETNFVRFIYKNRQTIYNLIKLGLIVDSNLIYFNTRGLYNIIIDFNYSALLSSADELIKLVLYQINIGLLIHDLNSPSPQNSDKYILMGDIIPIWKDIVHMNQDEVNLLSRVFSEVTVDVNISQYKQIIHLLKEINSIHYQNLINIVSRIYQYTRENKFYLVATRMNPDIYLLVSNFLRVNPDFFRFVSLNKFFTGINKDMNEAQFRAHIQRLHNDYINNRAAAGEQELPGQALQIHDFSNTLVDSNGKTLSLNNAVLEAIAKDNPNPYLYDRVVGILKTSLDQLKEDPLKSKAINDDVFSRLLSCNNESADQGAMCQVVTYLLKKDPSGEKLKTWLYVFMEECRNAYARTNPESCVKGVRERVITSLRSALPDDPDLSKLFAQAEKISIFKVKRARLNDLNYWARLLLEKGVKSTTPEKEVQEILTKIMEDNYNDIKTPENADEIISGINNIVDDAVFLTQDDQPGIWGEQFVPRLKRLESGDSPIDFGDHSSSDEDLPDAHSSVPAAAAAAPAPAAEPTETALADAATS
ncbi:MAG: hypothetical protein HEEMFOPI_00794 [Holosporales bacterium]